MNPYYVCRNGYTIVLTPHARKSWDERITHVKYGATYEQLDEARKRMKLDAVSGIGLRSDQELVAYLYCRRIFNYKRCREELEIISVTPTDIFLSDGVSRDGHQHNQTEMVKPDDPVRIYCFCCRKEISEFNQYDQKYLCKNHPVSCLR